MFCSSTRSNEKEIVKRLGRGVSEEEKAIDFHILDYEPDLTRFEQVSCSDRAITAVDQDGAVWILCGVQYEYGELNLPQQKNNHQRSISRPINTSWMA